MNSRDNDDADDPKRFRRTLVPLDIEDAEKPPPLGRRFKRLFGKKNDGEAESEAPGNAPRGGPSESISERADRPADPFNGREE
jgi:hypothetical protein